VFHLSLDTIRRCISDAGYIPRQRNVYYEYIDEYPPTNAAPRPRPLPGLPVLATGSCGTGGGCSTN
jgi:cyclic dehypoxanthinyl futalosine synthase